MVQSFRSDDWSESGPDDQMMIARNASEPELRDMAREYDWSQHPEAVLGWILARKGIDLGTALTAFFNGDPERFNYIPKRDVPEEYRGVARLLDNICLRLNCGFYIGKDCQPLVHRRRLENWLTYQQADRGEGQQGRWILDEKIVGATLVEKTADKPEMVLSPVEGQILPQAEVRTFMRSDIRFLSPALTLKLTRRFKNLLSSRG